MQEFFTLFFNVGEASEKRIFKNKWLRFCKNIENFLISKNDEFQAKKTSFCTKKCAKLNFFRF